MDIKTIITFVVVPIVSITTSYFTAKSKTTKELIKKAKEEQRRDDEIVLIKERLQGHDESVKALNEHREDTNIALVEVKADLASIKSQQTETQSTVSKIYTFLIKNK